MGNTPLEIIANLSQIIGAATVVVGLVFAWFQIRLFHVQQNNTVNAELMRTFYSRDLAHAVVLLYELPDRIPAVELREQGKEYEEAAIIVTTTFETMGLLVFQRIAPLGTVTDLAGGMIGVTWRKLERWLETVRAEQSQPSWAEWFEWLAAQATIHKSRNEPAYVRCSDWKP
jgi:hypothetical protein